MACGLMEWKDVVMVQKVFHKHIKNTHLENLLLFCTRAYPPQDTEVVTGGVHDVAVILVSLTVLAQDFGVLTRGSLSVGSPPTL